MDPSLTRIAREAKAKAIFFQKHPGRKPQEYAELIDIDLSLMDSYFEARERIKSQEKKQKQSLNKKGNHKFHDRRRHMPKSCCVTKTGK